MSKTKMNAIPRAASQPATSLDDWVGGEAQAQADAPAAKLVTIKAAVTPELRRRLRVAAAEQDTNVANVLRALAERWLEEQGYFDD